MKIFRQIVMFAIMVLCPLSTVGMTVQGTDTIASDSMTIISQATDSLAAHTLLCDEDTVIAEMAELERLIQEETAAIAEANDSLQKIRHRIQQLKDTIALLNADLAVSAMADSFVASRMNDIADIEKKIDTALDMVKSIGCLSSLDIEPLSSAVSEYEAQTKMIAGINSAKNEELAAKVVILRKASVLSENLRNSINLMSGRFNGEENIRQVDALSSCVRELAQLGYALSASQEVEYVELTEALRGQQAVYDKIVAFIDVRLGEEELCIPSEKGRETLNITATIKNYFGVSEVGNYRYYLSFNKALKQLETDLKAGSSFPIEKINNDEVFGKYLKEIKKIL